MNPIKRLRTQTGATQKQLALRASTSQPTIAAYETGQKSPTLETLERLARSLGLEVSISFVPPLTREDLRSLAYHMAIIGKLKIAKASILTKARKNLEAMAKSHPHGAPLFKRWRQWLDFPLDDLINLCLDPGLLARDMRQVTPFAGVLNAKERLHVIKGFRKEEER
jgi:transcriptional regulator with XRE-family HTH domain